MRFRQPVVVIGPVRPIRLIEQRGQDLPVPVLTNVYLLFSIPCSHS